jgi:hypothetical protein
MGLHRVVVALAMRNTGGSITHMVHHSFADLADEVIAIA